MNNVNTEGKSWTSFINALRQLSLRYDTNRKQAEKNARRAPATYECATCGRWIYTGKKTLKAANIQAPEGVEVIQEFKANGKIKKHKIDHIVPFRPVTGERDIFDIFKGLFAELENYAVICDDCHSSKSRQENKFRREFKKLENGTEEWDKLLEEYNEFMGRYL